MRRRSWDASVVMSLVESLRRRWLRPVWILVTSTMTVNRRERAPSVSLAPTGQQPVCAVSVIYSYHIISWCRPWTAELSQSYNRNPKLKAELRSVPVSHVDVRKRFLEKPLLSWRQMVYSDWEDVTSSSSWPWITFVTASISKNKLKYAMYHLTDGHAIPGSGLLLTTWQTPTLGFRKQERQLMTGSTVGCLRSIAQRTRSGACSYWIRYITSESEVHDGWD